MITAKDLMTGPVVCISPTHSMLEAARLMTEKGFKHLAVENNGKLVGIISDRDLFKAMRSDYINSTHMELSLNSTQKVEDYMSWPVFVVSDTTPLENIIEEFLAQKVSAFIVENPKGQMKGIITIDDILAHYLIDLKRNSGEEFTKGESLLY